MPDWSGWINRVQQTSVRVIKRTDHARAAILHAGNLRSDDCCITLRGEDLGHGIPLINNFLSFSSKELPPINVWHHASIAEPM